MIASYSGMWSRTNRVDGPVPTHADIDPEHLDPSDDMSRYPVVNQLWQASAPAPDLPPELYPAGAPELPTGLGPVVWGPQDPSWGLGAGPALDTLQAQDTAAPWHNTDDGSVAVQHWVPMREFDDRPGSPHLDEIDDMIGDGESPKTLQYKRTGVGQPNDPNARLAKRIARWRDRWVDMHRYEVVYPPIGDRNAYNAPHQPPVPGGGPNTSPYPTTATWYVGPHDRFVPTLVRRAPGDWAEPESSDAAAESSAGAATAYGLTSWGL